MSLIEDTNSITYSSSSSQDDKITYEFVDMGLSVKWATCNIGARSPEESGWYFQWAGTTAYNANRTPVGDGDPILFDFDNCPYCNEPNGYYSNFSKYNKNDNRDVLELSDDAAHIHMGNNWRMPSKAEFDELIDACDIEYKEQNNNWQMVLTNKIDSSKKLIFPLANCLNDNLDTTPEPVCGLYWLIGDIAHISAQTTYILPYNGEYSSAGYHTRYFYRCTGCSIRGVC